MKKIYYLIAMAMMAFTFTSCEDVPEPFGQPVNPNKGSEETIDPTGDGTAASPYNVAAVLDYLGTLGADVTSPNDVYVSGVVTEVTEAFGTQYGNATFKMADTETSKQSFTFYRGLYLGNKKYDDTSATNIKVGDKVVVCGKVVNYKGNTPETSQGNAYVVSINGEGGSDTPTPTPSGNHGTAEAPLTVAQAIALIDAETTISEAYVKGKISQIDSYSDQYKSITYWISDDGGTTTQLQVYSGKGLNGADFSAKEDLTVGQTVVVKGKLKKYNTTYEFDKTSSIISIEGQGSGGGESANHGTAEAPLTVVQAIALIDAESTIDEAYVKGKISQIDSYSSQYKSITYWISDDGGTTTQLQVYSGKGLNGADFSAKEDLTVGQTVVVKGKLKKYNTTYEFDKTSSIISIEGSGSGEGGGGETSSTGTLANPLTPSQIYDIVAAMEKGVTSTEDYYVKGKICSIKFEYSAQYGTATFNISDDGNAGNKEFIAYSTYYHASEQKWVEGDTQVAVGDEVVVCGKVVNYNGNTPEFASKKSYVVTINGK